MRITKGKVVDGHVIVEGEQLGEGSTVTVLISDERTFTLDGEEEAAFLQAIAEADRDDLIDGDEVIQNLS